MGRLRRIADRWEQYLEHIHMDIPEEQVEPVAGTEANKEDLTHD